MDPFELLSQDHRKILGITELMQDTEDFDDLKRLFHAVRAELEDHTEIEEAVLYPSFADDPALGRTVEDFYSDHQEIKDLIQDILEEEEDAAEVEAAMDELVDTVERHIQEEEAEFFPRARSSATPMKLREISRQIAEARRRVKEKPAA